MEAFLKKWADPLSVGKRKQTGSILPKTAELCFSKAALTRSGFSGVTLLSGRFSETGRLADLSPVLPQ